MCSNIVVTDWVLLQWRPFITQAAVSVCHLNRFTSTNYAAKLISLQLEHSGCSHINSINSSTAVWDTVVPRIASTEGSSELFPAVSTCGNLAVLIFHSSLCQWQCYKPQLAAVVKYLQMPEMLLKDKPCMEHLFFPAVICIHTNMFAPSNIWPNLLCDRLI